MNKTKSRNTDEYVFVEVALPKHHASVVRMIAEAESLDKSLRQVVKETCLKAYAKEGEMPDAPPATPQAYRAVLKMAPREDTSTDFVANMLRNAAADDGDL